MHLRRLHQLIATSTIIEQYNNTMRTFIVAALIAGASAFGVPPMATSRRSTALNEFLSPEDRADKIARWGEIRAMSAEEAAANLAGEELEAYNRYYEEVRDGVLKMQELAGLMMKDVEPPRIQPKSKNQRKRDKWALVQRREAAKAAAKP